MGDCRDLDPLFTPYVDGEADGADRERLRTHLGHCPPCRDRVEDEREARETLRAHRAELRVPASDPLRRRCAACFEPQRPAAPAAHRPAAWRRLVPLSLAATILLAVGGVFLIGVDGSAQSLANQLALDHVKCFQLAPPHATVTPDGASRTWATRYGWGIIVPPSAPDEQLELLDVRRCLSSEGMTAHLMYRWRGAPLSMYVLNHEPDDPWTARYLETRIGPDAVVWTAGGRTYAVLARGQRDQLNRVAQYLRTVAR